MDFKIGLRPEAVGDLLNRKRTEEEQVILEYILWLEETVSNNLPKEVEEIGYWQDGVWKTAPLKRTGSWYRSE